MLFVKGPNIAARNRYKVDKEIACQTYFSQEIELIIFSERQHCEEQGGRHRAGWRRSRPGASAQSSAWRTGRGPLSTSKTSAYHDFISSFFTPHLSWAAPSHWPGFPRQTLGGSQWRWHCDQFSRCKRKGKNWVPLPMFWHSLLEEVSWKWYLSSTDVYEWCMVHFIRMLIEKDSTFRLKNSNTWNVRLLIFSMILAVPCICWPSKLRKLLKAAF